ncbi:MAG TPA: DUF5309 domain-containing protein [Caulobacteraceae bacterium]|jgi:hypothetical protein
MSAPSNTVTTLTNVGDREDLEDVIYRVAPEETPFIANIGKTSASAVFHEWQTETLATPVSTNAQLEGDDISAFDAPNLTTRVGNYNQIARKSFVVSRTAEIVDKAGRKSEVNRQKVLKGIELRRDIEMRVIGNYGSNAESGGTTRKTAGALAWLTSNTSKGAGGADGGFSTGVVSAATNGTQRSFTETLVKAVLASAFSNGARPKQAYLGPTQKQEFSTFTGIADIRAEAAGGKMATIYGAADVYVSDFGNLALIPHPYGLTRDVLLADPEFFALGVLDGVKSKQLSDTGDSTKFMLTQESCLVCRNEKAHAVIRDVQ